MAQARVLDREGRPLSPCDADKALRMVREGRAELVSSDPLTVRVSYAVALPQPDPAPDPLTEERLLLHICCGPCATYTVRTLRERGAQLTGYWFNPNIHPFGEHELRRESLEQLAQAVELPMVWEPGYRMPEFLAAVAGHEPQEERCRICYRLRMEATARAAAERGFPVISTTLLISPYQDLEAIREIGVAAAAAQGVRFYFENLRRGFSEHYRLARIHDLYLQRYCGCLYSEWESRDRRAWTRRHKPE